MTGADAHKHDRRRAATLAAIIVLQGLSAVYFIADVLGDFAEAAPPQQLHLFIEAVAALGLTAGVILMALELRTLLSRMDQMDRGIRAARGDMMLLIEASFDRWELTPSEREVALLILKGFDNDLIAAMRGVAAGTVRAQSARIYAKAGVDSRSQLFSVFLDELMTAPTDGVAPNAAHGGVPMSVPTPASVSR